MFQAASLFLSGVCHCDDSRMQIGIRRSEMTANRTCIHGVNAAILDDAFRRLCWGLCHSLREWTSQTTLLAMTGK